MVPLWVPIIIRHLLFRVPQRDPNFDNHPYGLAILRPLSGCQRAGFGFRGLGFRALEFRVEGMIMCLLEMTKLLAAAERYMSS